MGVDRNYFYDFKKERKLDWQIVAQNGEIFRLACETKTAAGEFVWLFPVRTIYDIYNPIELELEVNGQAFHPEKDTCTAYIGNGISRYGLRVTLTAGINHFGLTVKSQTEDPRQWLSATLINDLAKSNTPGKYHAEFKVAKEKFPGHAAEIDHSGFTPGVGCLPSPGRFAFSKGDGILDCAMPLPRRHR